MVPRVHSPLFQAKQSMLLTRSSSVPARCLWRQESPRVQRPARKSKHTPRLANVGGEALGGPEKSPCSKTHVAPCSHDPRWLQA